MMILFEALKTAVPGARPWASQIYEPTLKIVLFLLLLLNKTDTDVSSRSGGIQMTDHTKWRRVQGSKDSGGFAERLEFLLHRSDLPQGATRK